MFFTREDILKIQQALLQLGVKDSELPSTKSITYDDTLSIVQDDKNKRIKIKDFFNQISLLKKEDFFNITDKYDEHYISLTKAINLVPILQRKEGLVITFQDVEGNWEIYQFRGDITEFFEENKWFDLYDYRNYIVQSIVPDEEDLTVSTPDENGNSYLSLKDKEYNPEDFSGLGRIILRKNIVEVEDPTYGKVKKNVLYQDMINKENTIYEIRYDFILREDITIPANCVLEFDGGSISGAYTLIGNYTCIIAPLTKIFGLDINIDGVWKIEGAYPEWFGANPKEAQFDNTAAIQKVLDTRHFKTMLLEPDARYAVNDTNNDGYCLIMQNYTHIIGNNSEIVHFSDNTNPIVFKIAINWNSGMTEARHLRIKGIAFSNYDSNWALECADSFALYDFLLENCQFYSTNSHSLKIAESCSYAHSVIRNCSFEGTSQIFMFDRCIVENSFFSGFGCALDIQSEYGCMNNIIQNNTIVNKDGAINLTGVIGVRILNNQIEHFNEKDSQHEKMCSIYIKGGSFVESGITKYYDATNIVIKDNNFGGGLHLKRSIYVENGVRVVLQDNRFGASCTEEDVYIASSCVECMVRSNFKEGNNLLDVNDNGYRTYGTKRELLELNTENGVNPNLMFTLYEDNTLHIVGNPGNFVFGTGFIVGKFPPGYLPRSGCYNCGNATGICTFEITFDGYIKGIAYAGTNYNYTFPVFVVDRVLLS